MATRPKANVSIDAASGAIATGSDLCCVIAPVPQNADVTPRLFGSAKAAYAQHGYSEGLEYTAVHIDLTSLPVLFVGIPIADAGAIGRENTSGNSGTSVTSLAAGGDGVLHEHDGKIRVKTGGTVGTDQIVLEVSLDDGKSWKQVRLGTATSYVIPYVGVTFSATVGTLVAGEVVHTWHGTGPKGDATGWANAFTALKAQQKLFRSAIFPGDLDTDTEATAIHAQLASYETSTNRYTVGRVSAYERRPLASMSSTTHRMTGAPNVTFAEVGATGDTITRSAGSFVTDGFAAGDIITISGSASNDLTSAAKVATVTASVITLDTDDLEDEGPVAGVSIVGEDSLTFDSGDKTITRSAGSWLDDGFRVGDTVTVASSASNNGDLTVTVLTDTVMTVSEAVVDEVIGITTPSISTGTTKAAWMAAIDAEFAPNDDQPRINISAGRGRFPSPFSQWNYRFPAGFFASWRSYQHDLHITSWRKDLGNVGADLWDDDGDLVEWDDRADGGAGSAARFTTLTTYANDTGAYVTQDLTRAGDGEVLSYHHNREVTDAGSTVVQRATELFIGRTPELNADGTLTTDERRALESEVNSALERALLADIQGEGPRASSATWVAATDDDLSGVEAVLNGTMQLNLRGTIHTINTTIRVR